ncbi:MAG TPA: phosphomannomutase/phosphoglucomutase [Planctomycetota bacterium]|nr:phosphomannomutase/phosphoglucomutase [Planctomycetota bacterium]
MPAFKAYDVRGRYPDEIDDALAERIGYWTVKLLNARTLGIGRDVRMSAPAVAGAAARGACAAGARVLDFGVVTTPMTWFAVGHLRLDGGIMVTASHNPPQDIGFKICREGAFPIGERTGLKDLEAMTRNPMQPSSPAGAAETVSIVGEYRNHLRRFVGEVRPLRVAVDTANGCVGVHFDKIFGDLPVTFDRLFFEPDGRFPNHEPNPLKDANLKDLQKAIVENRADLGAAFDGDGDRCMFLDAHGRRVPSDLLTALLAVRELEKNPGAAVVYDLRSSRVVREEIEKAGGQPVRERVGHAFMKEAMKKHSAIMGGELSGHYYFREHYNADSGLLAFAKVLNVLGSQPLPIADLLAPYRRYPSTGELNFHVEDKPGAMEALAAAFKDGKQDRLDGITVEFDDWWFNIRPSNTEPLLRLNIEAASAPMLEEKKALVFEALKKSGAELEV